MMLAYFALEDAAGQKNVTFLGASTPILVGSVLYLFSKQLTLDIGVNSCDTL
jgi:hypothetical protein